MLMIINNEEFYEQEKPLSLKGIESLIILLRQALWQLWWVNHISSAYSVKSTPVSTTNKRLFIPFGANCHLLKRIGVDYEVAQLLVLKMDCLKYVKVAYHGL